MMEGGFLLQQRKQSSDLSFSVNKYVGELPESAEAAGIVELSNFVC